MNLLLHPAAFRIALWLALAVAAVIGWNLLTGYYEAKGYDRAKSECRAEKARSELAAAARYRAQVKQMIDDRKKADDAATERYAKLAADFDTVRRSNLGLRNAVASLRASLPAAPAEAVRETADTALAVFGECADEVGRLAQAADGHAADVQTLSEAWPR